MLISVFEINTTLIRVRLNRVGGWGGGGGRMGGSWVVGRVCLKIKNIYTLAPSVLGPNLQMPAHELISSTPFMKLSPISFWSGKQFR